MLASLALTVFFGDLASAAFEEPTWNGIKTGEPGGWNEAAVPGVLALIFLVAAVVAFRRSLGTAAHHQIHQLPSGTHYARNIRPGWSIRPRPAPSSGHGQGPGDVRRVKTVEVLGPTVHLTYHDGTSQVLGADETIQRLPDRPHHTGPAPPRPHTSLPLPYPDGASGPGRTRPRPTVSKSTGKTGTHGIQPRPLPGRSKRRAEPSGLVVTVASWPSGEPGQRSR